MFKLTGEDRKAFAKAAETGVLNEDVLEIIGTAIEYNESTIDNIWVKVRSNDQKWCDWPTKYELTDMGFRLTYEDRYGDEATDYLPYRYLFDEKFVEETVEERKRELAEAEARALQLKKEQEEKAAADERALFERLKSKYGE